MKKTLPEAWTFLGWAERKQLLQGLPLATCRALAKVWARRAISEAKRVLPIWESRYPADDRPRKAIEAGGRALADVAGVVSASARAADAASYAARAVEYAAYAAYATRMAVDAAADAANAVEYAAYAARMAVDAAADAANAAARAAGNAAAYAARAVDAAADAANAAARAVTRAVDAAADASHVSMCASYSARAAEYVGSVMWEWIYRTYLHAKGPDGAEFLVTWKTTTTISLAREIVQSRDFSLMPILADALQDAGCDREDTLTHLRKDEDEWTEADWVLTHLTGGQDS